MSHTAGSEGISTQFANLTPMVTLAYTKNEIIRKELERNIYTYMKVITIQESYRECNQQV